MNDKSKNKNKYFNYSVYIFVSLLIFNLFIAKHLEKNVSLYLNILQELAFIVALFFEIKLENATTTKKVFNIILIIATILWIYMDYTGLLIL